MGIGRAAILKFGWRFLLVLPFVGLPGIAECAAAQPILRKVTIAEAAFQLGRQAGISIAIRDPIAGRRRVPAIHSDAAPVVALTRLAQSARLVVKRVGIGSYILEETDPQGVKSSAPPHAPRSVSLRRSSRRGPVGPGVPGDPQVIVVTASKRDVVLGRFAGQWAQIEGKDLKGWGVAGSEAIESRSVGFSSTHLGAGRNKLFIRGIGDSSFSGPTQSPVGQYIGDLRTGYGGPDPDLQLVDMASIEVLEGPQGTLYGAGSLGGIVLLRPRTPVAGALTGEITVGASATQHGEMGTDLSGVINAPIGRDGAVRAVGYRVVQGGYIDNLTTGEQDANKVTTSGGRAALSVPLNANWDLELGAIGQRIRGDDSQYSDESGRPLTRSSAADLNFSSDFRLASFAVSKPTGVIRLRSTVGITSQRVHEKFDAAFGLEPRVLRQSSSGNSFVNETRVWRPMRARYSWLVGFSTLSHRYEVGRKLISTWAQEDLAGVENRVREATLYGEVAGKITPSVTVTVGTRLTRTTLSGRGHHLRPVNTDDRLRPEVERTQTRVLPSASLSAAPFENSLFYARYQQGFRPGGFSLNEETVRRFRNDSISTAEVGFRIGEKSRSGWSLGASLTRSFWKNIQADFIDSRGLPSTANIGDGRVWSVGLNVLGIVTPSLKAEFGAAWNDGRVVEPDPRVSAIERGRNQEIPNIARLVGRAGLNWSRKLRGEVSVTGSTYVRYVGRSRLGIGPKLGQTQGSYFDSGLSLRLGNRTRAVSLSATNLTDEVGNRFAFGTPLAVKHDQVTPLRPRTIRIGFDAAF